MHIKCYHDDALWCSELKGCQICVYGELLCYYVKVMFSCYTVMSSPMSDKEHT